MNARQLKERVEKSRPFVDTAAIAECFREQGYHVQTHDRPDGNDYEVHLTYYVVTFYHDPSRGDGKVHFMLTTYPAQEEGVQFEVDDQVRTTDRFGVTLGPALRVGRAGTIRIKHEEEVHELTWSC